LIIQAYPSSEFGGQEFNENEKIAEFVKARGFTGPNAMLMDKVKVNGGNSSPVFKFLKNRVGQVLVGVLDDEKALARDPLFRTPRRINDSLTRYASLATLRSLASQSSGTLMGSTSFVRTGRL